MAVLRGPGVNLNVVAGPEWIDDVNPARLAIGAWRASGQPPADEIFRSGYLSAVVGLQLAAGREVVVKVRRGSPRTAACVEVKRRDGMGAR